ncbi:MAG: helix-turn-helix domain-containing protein [Lachnospiraceae bacterium]|nr:helix-turn-helix domain-containing protein [Lachnospiraceae bacterium]
MENRVEELVIQEKELKKLREDMGLSRKEFAEYYGIPLRTVEDWEAKKRKMPTYLLRLMLYKAEYEKINKEKKSEKIENGNVNIITDVDGKKIVLINDIRFKGKRREEWEEIEEYLKEYVGKCYEIAETAEKIYIGTDFPDEFVHAKDRLILRGPNAKAKANASQAVGELIQIATNKTSAPDHNSKHKNKARFGWYRYDTRLALPVYDDVGNLISYNIFKLRMLVRCDSDGKMYLYDFLRTKKETSSPLE